MIRTKKLLKYCSNNDAATRIIRKIELNRYCYFLFCCFFEFMLYCILVIILAQPKFIFWILGFLFVVPILHIYIRLPFWNKDEIGYINLVLLENATVKSYKIQKMNYQYVFILNDEDEMLQLNVASIYHMQKGSCEYIRCRVYRQLENNRIEKRYDPIDYANNYE